MLVELKSLVQKSQKFCGQRRELIIRSNSLLCRHIVISVGTSVGIEFSPPCKYNHTKTFYSIAISHLRMFMGFRRIFVGCYWQPKLVVFVLPFCSQKRKYLKNVRKPKIMISLEGPGFLHYVQQETRFVSIPGIFSHYFS